MLWSLWATLLCFFSASVAINRPVYKIILTQQGFTQFLQYDVETPPIREFTFCMWLRVFSFDKDQTLFSYIVNGDNRILRLWLDSGGRNLKVSLNGESTSNIPVEFTKDVWRHVCLSYQSDFGAWALYIDSRLLSCEASQNLFRFVIPRGGSIIVGYGTDEHGFGRGLEGEVYGVNLILASTIERNYTMKIDPEFAQKSFQKNKIHGSTNLKYVVLKDLQTEEMTTVLKTTSPSVTNASKSFVKISTPYSYIDHIVGIQPSTIKNHMTNQVKFSFDSKEKESTDLATDQKPIVGKTKGATFWNIVNEGGHSGKFRKPSAPSSPSEFDLPPPVSTRDYYVQTGETDAPPVATVSIHKLNEDFEPKTFHFNKKQNNVDEISEYELPPPPETNSNVYGQWTSSKYAGSVLNYLKSINFYYKDKKIPPTIPLFKVSDANPYPSDFKNNVVRPPTNIKRKSLGTPNKFHNQYIQPASLKFHHFTKREVKVPQINIKILGNDIRDEIIKSHAKTRPKHVEITNRGETKKRRQSRIHKNKESSRYTSNHNHKNVFKSSSNLITSSSLNTDILNSNFDLHKSNSLFNVLPFLKSVEYFTGDNEELDTNVVNSNDMYTKSFSSTDKWHNIKSYNNDFTPRQPTTVNSDTKELDAKPVWLKYKPETNKIVDTKYGAYIENGIKKAIDVSNQSDHNRDRISIIKYNHGYLPGHTKAHLNKGVTRSLVSLRNNNNFNENVKLGNALNEKQVIGINEEQTKQSFVGGNEKIPDINRYRSDIDNVTDSVPASLKPNICKNVELYDNILYVHPDGSIDMTHILSPLKEKNKGIDFVIQNYKKCSLEESSLEHNDLLLIDWNKTPVRLFGGPTPKKTKDLCGFF